MTKPVASLTRLSPLMIVSSVRGSGTSSAIASVATASVGERIAPSTNPSASGKPISQCATYATITEVNATSPIASMKIGW